MRLFFVPNVSHRDFRLISCLELFKLFNFVHFPKKMLGYTITMETFNFTNNYHQSYFLRLDILNTLQKENHVVFNQIGRE